MPHYRDIVHLFREVSRIACNYEGYSRYSYIVEGSRRLASMIERGFFPEENCHWIAKSILPTNRTHLALIRATEYHFDADFACLMRNLVIKLHEITQSYTSEREGSFNRHFQRIITIPSEQFTTFFPGNSSNYSYRKILAQENVSDLEDSGTDSDTDSEYTDDFDNDSHREILAQGGALDSEDDTDEEDDFIDPENAPAYEQYDGPLPLYENRHRDKLLESDSPPEYSEFSLRMMLQYMARNHD